MTAVEPSTPGPAVQEQWRRAGGVLGLVWALLFVVGVFVIQGSTPERDDSIAQIRNYFTDHRDAYLLGDYLVGVAFTLFFLPFLVILRRVLGTGGGWADLLSRVALFAGVLAVLWGGVAGFFWGALAIGAAANPEVDDSVVRALMELDTYAFTGLLLPIGLFLGAAGLSMWLSRTLWRWVGVVGIIGFLGSYIGAAWPVDGDEDGPLAAIGLVGLVGILIFVVLVSINLLLLKRGRSATEPTG